MHAGDARVMHGQASPVVVPRTCFISRPESLGECVPPGGLMESKRRRAVRTSADLGRGRVSVTLSLESGYEDRVQIQI